MSLNHSLGDLFMTNVLKDTNSKLGENVLDKELIPLTAVGGYDISNLKMYRMSNMLLITGYVNGDFPQNTYSTVARIPTKYRPTEVMYSGAATVGGNVGFVDIGTNGNIRLNQRTGRSDLTWMGFTVMYFLDT